MQKPYVVEITDTHQKETGIINVLQSTLRRMSGSFGFGISPDGKRDYNALFGYGETLSYTDFYGMYKRSGFGNVIVKKVAKACWGELPTLKSGDVEILDDEIKTLAKLGFFSAIQRADILNRIGSFSVLLIGLPDGLDLDKPLGLAGKRIENLYFNPYNYDGITISKWDNDPTSIRYQKPEIYQLQTSFLSTSFKDLSFKAINVHWSRIIHLAEGTLDSSIEGESSLEAPWNSILDCEKIRGGSSEAFFRNARQQRALEADKDARLEPGSEASAALKENIEAFDNGWDSTLRLQNMKAQNLPINLATPRASFDVSVETLSGQTGIPIRILTGKGGGQTTGSEDRASWNALILDRRNDFCNGVLLRGLEILQEAGLLKLPDNVEVEWPPQSANNEKDQSEVNKNKAETFAKVVDAMSKVVGDEADVISVLAAVGLEDISIDVEAILDDDEPEPTNVLPDND